MIKISFILPEEKMKALAIKTFEEHNRLDQFSGGQEFVGSFMVTLQPELYVKSLRESDIIVARGVTALNIKRQFPDMAVVEIPISGHDILSTVIRIVKENGKITVGIVNSVNMVYSASNIVEYLGAELKKYIFEVNTPEEIRRHVDRAIRDGCRAIMGGIDTCDYAHSRGVPSYPLPMSRESIWQAISEAKHNAMIRHSERAKAIQYQTVINYAGEGVIATNRSGNIITFNSAAEKMLGIDKKDAVGFGAEAVLRDTGLNAVLCNEQEYHNTFINYRKYTLSVNKIRMNLDGSYIGDVVTFQDVASIQKAESIIRDKIYSRGHVARYNFSNIIGDSPQLQEVTEMARVYANVQSNILITGETGTGKELLAQSIHNGGKRKNGPFVAVNCAALARSLIESELFGYAEGAFTGASKGGKPGVFELAHGGTIFLDEISEMPLDIQGRLLRVIQEKEIVRIGDDRVVPVDVRVICASNRSLIDLVGAGEFRQDLYYRLNVLTLHIPPLRERRQDVLALVRYYLDIYTKSFGKRHAQLSEEAQALLRSQEWHGNIREIRNVCERLIILNQTGIITKEEALRALSTGHSFSGRQNAGASRSDAAASREREQLLGALESCGYDKPAAARILGISRTTLWRRMKRFGIPMEEITN